MSLSRVILNLDDSESALRVKTLGGFMFESAIDLSEIAKLAVVPSGPIIVTRILPYISKNTSRIIMRTI